MVVPWIAVFDSCTAMSVNQSETRDDCTGMYVKAVQKGPCKMIVTLLVLTAALAPFALKLSSTTTDNFTAAPNTRSYDENHLLTQQFPSVFNDRESLYVHCAKCNNASDFKQVFDKLEEGLAEFKDGHTLVSFTSYFSFQGPLANLSFGYYNQTAHSMLASLEFNSTNEDGTKAAVTKAIDLTKKLTVDDMRVYITGQTASRLLGTAAAGKMIGMADGTGMILIVLLFGWQVHSWRLTLIPVFNTILCLLIAEAIIYPLAKSGAIVLPSYVTNVCLFLSIALSVDYSFFHLSRFQEVRREGADLVEAVDAMVRTAGRVVLVSGVVLLCTWLALAAFPVFGTNSLGYCSAITIFVCICVNLTMNPAIIFAFPKFFDRAGKDGCCYCCKRRSEEAREPLTVETHEDVTKNFFGRLAIAILKCPTIIIVPIIVYAVLLPGAIRLFTADMVVGGISGGTPETKHATQRIEQEYQAAPSGVPLTIILAADGIVITSDKGFQAACSLAQTVHKSIESLDISMKDFRGAVIDRTGSCLSWSDAEKQLNSPIPYYKHFWPQSVNEANTSIMLSVALPFDTFNNTAKDLVKKSRSAVDTFSDTLKTFGIVGKAAVFHPMAVEIDAEELTVGRFPWVVLATCAVVFTVLAIRYKSFLLPFRMLLTTALPIISVLGTGVFVFQDGYLNWTGIPSMQSEGGLVWINPIACTFMLIGFALDYDIFLFSRIYADRKTGVFLDDEPAIINAVAKTGPVITTAGCIMALAFSGMVLQSTNPFLSQMGFTMIYGILMDTFIVRTLLVPTFLNMAGRFNWLPMKMPSDDAEAKSTRTMSGASMRHLQVEPSLA